MRPQDGDGFDDGEPTVVELLRLARSYQEIVHDLLARAEEMSATADTTLAVVTETENDLPASARRRFTEREAHVAELLVKGMSNRRIARTLAISERTVKNHLHSIFYKLGVSDRTQAVIVLMKGRTAR